MRLPPETDFAINVLLGVLASALIATGFLAGMVCYWWLCP